MKHPAKYADLVLEELAYWLSPESLVLDPFAGTGKLARLKTIHPICVEIEPEWATQIVGDALALPFADNTFDAIATSPCLEQSQRVLTDDLRWVPVGDVEVGDRLLAFDESGPGATATGANARRRWRRSEVVRSEPRTVDCVRVVLANGDEVITTPEHPWLVSRYGYGGRLPDWVRSRDLMGYIPMSGRGQGRGWQQGRRNPSHVLKQMGTWSPRTGYDAGWLAGMFDGEGSLSLGVHGSPKMQLCQVEGPVLDRAETVMTALGYHPNRFMRARNPPHQKIGNLYVTGGFPGLLRALGELRPIRLLNKWANLDIATRTVQAEKVQVVAVEPAGRRTIQEIETTEGTYFGEGYLMHNCYANRMADHHNAKDKSVRHTYKHYLGRDLHPNNSGQMQWGDAYRVFHLHAWGEAVRVLKPGGMFLLNSSDHIRKGEVQHVTDYHVTTLEALGLLKQRTVLIGTDRLLHGANYKVRVDHETVTVFKKGTP